jgi:hypothetical protein
MINTHLVLVSLSVYTFSVSNTMFPRPGQGIDAYSCKKHLSEGVMLAREANLPGARIVWPHDRASQPCVS